MGPYHVVSFELHWIFRENGRYRENACERQTERPPTSLAVRKRHPIAQPFLPLIPRRPHVIITLQRKRGPRPV